MTVDLTLVRMCEVFETERRRTDEELMHRQEDLAFMATHDAITGLPNRTLMLDRGEQMLQRARRHRAPVAALLIDIDNLKQINDTLGHDGGDELLRAVATRLDAVVRGSDAVGRIGGDEFVIIADELSLAAGPELIAERLLAALREPFTLSTGKEHKTIVTASIGIAAGDRACTEELLRDADIAMCRAKWEGKDRFVLFDRAMHDAAQHEIELEMDLRDALSRDEFFLHYQPTFALRDMSATGMEALIRWRHPMRGTVQPGEFIPLLEKSGLVRQVGRWVLGEACRQAVRWHGAGYAVSVAVNVSARQLDVDDFVGEVRDSLSETGLDPRALTLEITETTLMSNAEATARRLAAIKDLGVRVAIDDFGTGYSSLAHLQRFPVDALKIDGSFVSNLDGNPDGEALIHTLVELGKALSIETVAEGIERHEQLSLLRREGCDSGQGYLFAPPMEAEAATYFLRMQLQRQPLSYTAQPA
jgi:diguanylate cyclase (GGDEF)-like protein